MTKLDINELGVCYKCTLRLRNVTDARLYTEYTDQLTTGERVFIIACIPPCSLRAAVYSHAGFSGDVSVCHV